LNPTDVVKAIKTEKVRENENTFEIIAKDWLVQKARRNSLLPSSTKKEFSDFTRTRHLVLNQSKKSSLKKLLL